MKQMKEGFGLKSTHLGFWITFKNKLTVSVQFGGGNYCDNRSSNRMLKQIKQLRLGKNIAPQDGRCKNAEIAIMYRRQFVTKLFLEDDDDVKGYVTPDEVVDIMSKVKNTSAKQLKQMIIEKNI